jgi:tRNA dimethylallyltransferase
MPAAPPPPLGTALLLLGPTASGKTATALELARRLPLEVVSVDSAQIYRDMNIGTAKPTQEERARCPHHLIDIVSPEESYSAARFRRDALQSMEEIAARGRIPLLAGGTMLYFKALREGLSELPEADPALRQEIEREAAASGWPALHAQLAQRDPDAALRLKPTDAQRIQRALEIVRLTGTTLAEAYAARRDSPPPFRFIAVALVPSDRSVLHQRIVRRFDAMLAGGLVDEVAALRRKYVLHAGMPSMRAVGYRQVWEHLQGQGDFETLRLKGTAATRQLAKRQLTWLRSMPDVHMVDCLAADAVQQVIDHIDAAGRR